jgi:hypothetical protein
MTVLGPGESPLRPGETAIRVRSFKDVLDLLGKDLGGNGLGSDPVCAECGKRSQYLDLRDRDSWTPEDGDITVRQLLCENCVELANPVE